MNRHGARECPRCKYERAMLSHGKLKPRAARRRLADLGPEAYLDDLGVLERLDSSPYDYQRGRQQVHTAGMMDRLGLVPDHLAEMQEPVRKAVARLIAKREGPRLRKVKAYGVGGSAAPAEIAKEIIANSGGLGFEFEVVRRDTPHLQAVGGDTLLIFASFSGNTEETLNCLATALRSRRAHGAMLAMSKGGELKKMARKRRIPWVRIPPYIVQPRESAALQVVAILTVISELRLSSGSPGRKPFCLRDETISAARDALQALTGKIGRDIPFRKNQAKQVAASLLCGGAGDGLGCPDARRIPIVLSSASNEAVAYEFYTQLCEASKVLCHVATYPEALHNLVECMKFGLVSGQSVAWSLYFLESGDDEHRVAQRWRHTLREVFPGTATCSFRAVGTTAFERSMSAYYFNAWVRLYAAFLNGAEPLPVPTMDYMKDYMKRRPRAGAA